MHSGFINSSSALHVFVYDSEASVFMRHSETEMILNPKPCELLHVIFVALFLTHHHIQIVLHPQTTSPLSLVTQQPAH